MTIKQDVRKNFERQKVIYFKIKWLIWYNSTN